MDPFNMPAFGAAPNPGARLQSDIGKLAPLATQYHGAQSGAAIPQYKATNTGSPSNLAKFGGFMGGIAKSVGHLAVQATEWLGKNTVQMAEAPVKMGAGLGNEITDVLNLRSIQSQNQQYSDQLATLKSQYKAGQISNKSYRSGLLDLSQNFDNLSKQSSALDKRYGLDQSNTVSASIDTASLVVTIMTSGFGKAASVALTKGGAIPIAEKGAAEYLASTNANALLSNVEEGINRIALNPELMAKLEPSAQKAIQTAAADVISQGGRMTSGQIARASAANLALKYPLTFTALGDTGKQVYQELDNAKYGDAVRTLAFNAALMVSGGVIGHAIQSGAAKGLLSTVSKATFGQTSFWDELSKFYGDGTTDGFYRAMRDTIDGIKDPKAKEKFINNLRAVEATNLNAVGNDAAAAANRVATGMKNYEGFNMTEITHTQALDNMVTFAKAQRIASTIAQKLGLGAITVGRVDARDLQNIADQLKGIPIENRADVWEQMKLNNPTRAWANNGNFDTQIKNLMKIEDGAEMGNAITNVKASFKLAGFPEAEARILAKMGYIPIKPVDLRAPFKEGKVITTNFGKEDFFTRAVQPLPILGFMGSMLTKAGLSPIASTQRVYGIFNQNLSRILGESKALKNFVANKSIQDQEGVSDLMIKKLSNFAHSPTRGGLNLHGTVVRPPIIDLRQLTTRDVMAALDVSYGDAREVKGAVMDAMLEVPLSIRGLGDRVMDLNYRLPGTAAYARIQGAFRFAWNPVFSAKLNYKTEILSQLESRGKFPTILGTNTILKIVFPDKYAQLDSVREVLRSRGILDEGAKIGSMTQEAANDAGTLRSNLNHQLLPGQERSIAGLISVQADRAGMSPQEFIDSFPHQVADTVQAIAQYDRHNGFLNSPMVRTLNLAFFPFRFELKVTTAFVKAMSKQPVLTQFALINGLFRAQDFLKSPQGQAWYAENADVIGIIKYFSPLDIMSTVANILGTKGTSIGAYGELGGLPFGWIPQTLDAAGLTHFGSGAPLISPTTGEVIPSYVPVTDRGRLQTAIGDLVGSLFTYPGATVGLPSKGSITRAVAQGITGGKSKSDFKQETKPLNAQQKHYQQTVQQQTGNVPPDPQQLANTPFSQGTNVPASYSPVTHPVPKQAGAAKAKRLKKSQFTPELLPGQSRYGQL